MIRLFRYADLDNINANIFSQDKGFKDAFKTGEAFSLLDGDNVMAIMHYLKYIGNNITGSFIISKDIRICHIKELKRALYNWLDVENIDRMQTISEACDTIDKWHEFLGLHIEGPRLERYAYGKDYRLWAWVKNGC